MKNLISLTKRNCLLFLRSKSTVFFSLFSSLILIVLYFLFIARLYSQGFSEVAGIALNSKQLNFAIYSQMIMGVLVINSVSLSTGIFIIIARDFESRKTDAFMLTNLKVYELILSYLISALLVAFILNFLLLVISVIIIGIATSYWLSAVTFFYIVGALMVVTIISCVIMLLITIIVKSSSAIGVINGILGTILGFLCGIYMPYTNLGTGAKYVGSLLPFTHLTIWLKQIVLDNVFAQLGLTIEVSKKMQDMWFSAGNIGLLGLDVPLWGMILISLFVAIVCFIISIFLFKFRLANINKTKTKKIMIKKK